ncbi:2-octaprenyl-6-methoxyphenol hydroxylase [Klebsiella pneumoniae]|uniref:2-octaprenyl-6-methoxyphenol hydroxylase n=1 Tax=Klebsiella pneumoniae TaxID=573 RepID=A0A378BR81_KLEPN|nr:2-octaprenyl-6-methoxyphenol hydroxylase [Klebsiella pneumoniae]
MAADGSRSSLGARCGISWQQQPYEQLAIIANVSTALPHEGRAFERFTEHGPLAMLPMSQGALFAGVVPSAVAARRGA